MPKRGRYAGFKRPYFSYAKTRLLPGCSGGYDHCERLIPAFFALAHGLYALARLILPFEVFEQISLPTAKNFSRFYAKGLLNAKQVQPKLYFRFPSEFRIFNEILSVPPAKTVLTQLYFPRSKAFYLDHDTMVENLADEILKARTLNQKL